MRLFDGGAAMEIDGEAIASDPTDTLSGEYPRLYHKMAGLIAVGASDVDLSPLRHVADAFLLGRRDIVAPFDP